MVKRATIALFLLVPVCPCAAKIVQVDPNGAGEYATIQDAVDDANNGDVIILLPGTFSGEGNRDVNFMGKAVTVRSRDPNDPCRTEPVVIDCGGTSSDWHRAFYFHSGEGPDSVLQGLTVTNGYERNGGAISCQGSPTIRNCIVVNSTSTMRGGAIYVDGGSPTLGNCTLCGNTAGSKGGAVCCDNGSDVVISNSILWGNSAADGEQIAVIRSGNPSVLSVSYTDMEGGRAGVSVSSGSLLLWGLGNIDIDPCFVDAESGDYHLQSRGWRWDRNAKWWVNGPLMSRCVDAGNPGCPLGDEPLFYPDILIGKDYGENFRINIGAYGGTYEASIGPTGWPLQSDLTNDWTVHLADLAGVGLFWGESGDCLAGDVDRDGTVGIDDASILTQEWLEWSQVPPCDPVLDINMVIHPDVNTVSADVNTWSGQFKDIYNQWWHKVVADISGITGCGAELVEVSFVCVDDAGFSSDNVVPAQYLPIRAGEPVSLGSMEAGYRVTFDGQTIVYDVDVDTWGGTGQPLRWKVCALGLVNDVNCSSGHTIGPASPW